MFDKKAYTLLILGIYCINHEIDVENIEKFLSRHYLNENKF